MPEAARTVAAIVTEYRVCSHMDNIVTRLLAGYETPAGAISTESTTTP